MIFRNVLDIVSLVDDKVAIVRQERMSLLFQYKVAEQKGMVCHDYIRAIEMPSRPPVEAVAKVRTFSSSAVSVLAFNRIPGLSRRAGRQIA